MTTCPLCKTVHDGTACPDLSIRTSDRIIMQGWQCPKCLTVYAPHVRECGCQRRGYHGTIQGEEI